MNKFSFPWIFCILSSLSIGACARAENLPDQPKRSSWQFVDVAKDKSALDEHLRAAYSADQEPDLLKRCLQFPDLPGTKWPQNHVRAHCLYHFGHLGMLNEIATYIAKKDFGAIEKTLDQADAQHEKYNDESIHSLIYALSGRADAMEVTQSWLGVKPESAFAHVIQAEIHFSSASEARGYLLATETSGEQFRQMYAHLDDAKKSINKALLISPELASAWSLAAKISKLGSDNELHLRMMARALEKDEYCAELARFVMDALLPRWGGSYEEMQDYAEHLKKKVSSNPMLLLSVSAAEVDAASLRTDSESGLEFKKQQMREVIAYSSNEVAMNWLANHVISVKPVNEGWGWEHAVLILQYARFHGINRDGAFSIFEQLAMHDPQWGIQYGKVAGTEVDGEVHSAITDSTYYTPMANMLSKVGATEDAEFFMLKADKNISADLLLMEANERLMDLWLAADEKKYPNKADKAKHYAERMVRSNSEHHFAWVAFNRYLKQVPTAVVDDDLLEKFSAGVNPTSVEEDPDFSELKKRLKNN